MYPIMSGLGTVDLVIIALVVLAAYVVWRSLWTIGPTEVGLVRKRFSLKKLSKGDLVAFGGEAGYQAGLLMAGLRFKLWQLYTVTRHPMVQIPAGQIGVVVAQVGATLPIGAKSAVYEPDFGNFQSIGVFVENGGRKGVQRTVLPPGTVVPVHPSAFSSSPRAGSTAAGDLHRPEGTSGRSAISPKQSSTGVRSQWALTRL